MHLAEELLIGAKAISKETGIKVRQVYRLAEMGQIPTFKVGGTVAARRSELQAHFASKERDTH
jgi:hypothetical protein